MYGSDSQSGATFPRARVHKYEQYPELHNSDRCFFLTCAAETGGRFSPECVGLVRALAKHRSEGAPRMLRKMTRAALIRRFWSLLSVAVVKGIAQSCEAFLEAEESDSGSFLIMPSHAELFSGLDIAPEVSRMA